MTRASITTTEQELPMPTWTIWEIDADGRGANYCTVNRIDDSGEVVHLDDDDEDLTVAEAIAACEDAGATWVVVRADDEAAA